MASRKKILFLAHWYPNEIDHHKGIFIENHAKCLAEIADLTVVSFDIRDSNYWFKSSQALEDKTTHTHCRITIESRFYKWFYYFIFFQFWYLKRILRRSKIERTSFDLIVSNVLFPSGIVAWKLAKAWGLKLIHIEHWSYFKAFLERDIHRFKARKMLTYVDQMLVVSEVLKEMVKDHFPEDRIHVIPNVVDPPFGYKEKVTSDKKHFLAISNWQNPKNPFPYLEALERLSKDFPLKLTMVGKGPILERVKQRTWSFEIDYPGNVKHENLGAYFHQADFFLHGSDFETFSIVGIEALITGTPVLANRVGVLPQLIHRGNGFLIENNAEDWYNALTKAVGTSYDHSMIAEEIKGRYSSRNISNKFIDIFNRV